MKHPKEYDTYQSSLVAQYVPRLRLDRIFDQATKCQLVYVIAGAGYGKTQAVRHYIEQQEDAVVRWMQLTESDNISSRYWESLTHTIAFDHPEFASKLRELGFPETRSRFKQFAEIVRNTEHRSRKTFLVLDDFHLIHAEEALLFAERCAHLHIPNTCVIMLSRTQPEINVVSLLSKGEVHTITEEELRFTPEDATAFFQQQAMPLSDQDIACLMDTTKGWALAINMFSLILKKVPHNVKYALDVMRKNMLQLMETEAWNDFSETAQKTLAKLSMLSDLPVLPFQELSNDIAFFQNTPGLSSFISFHRFSNEFFIHPLYLEFLQTKQHILSQEEKQETYQWAAQWCSEHDFHIDAMYYCAKSQQFDRMIQTLFSYPLKLSRESSKYFLSILENLAVDDERQDDTNILFLTNYFIPLLLVGAGRYREARERAQDVAQKWAHVDGPFAALLLYATYNNLAYIDMYTCVFTHKYEAPEYLRKAVEHYKRFPVPKREMAGAFINADLRSFACLVGEGADLSEFDTFLEASRKTAIYTEEMPYELYTGYEELVACEYAFFKNQPDIARSHAHSAIQKAREKKQYSIVATAEQYLLRIALQKGNVPLIKEILKQLHGHLDNPNFWNRQLYYDLYTGFFHVQTGRIKEMPEWLIMDEKEPAADIRMPVRELMLGTWYHIATKKYNQALTVLSASYPRAPHERFLFGELRFSLLTAVAHYHVGDMKEAMAELQRAYELSFQGVFEMAFIELGKELRPLIHFASKQENPGIPAEWLKKIERKISIYAKKITVVANALNDTAKTEKMISLSEREREVLRDLYHGLSREEIALNRYLSINTVKKILQAIYIKLDAHNNVDAIRIALEKKLID